MSDTFRGDNAHLVSCIEALLEMDADGILRPHGVGGHARGLLSAAAARLAPTQGADARPVAYMHRNGAAWELSFADDEGKLSAVHTKAIALYATRDAEPSDAPFGYVHVIASVTRPHDPFYRFSKKAAVELHPEDCSLVETVPVFRATAPREKT